MQRVPNRSSSLAVSPVTYALVAANVLVFGLQTQTGDALLRSFALWPPAGGFMPWQLLTSAFLHGSLLHLGSNMFGLWMFGRDVERTLGSLRFSQLYFLSVLTSGLAQLAVGMLSVDAAPTVGASGGLFGVLTAYAMLFPKNRIVLLIPPIPLPAPVFVVLYAGFELYAGVTGTLSGIAHFAHLGGLAGAFFLMRRWIRIASRRIPDS